MNIELTQIVDNVCLICLEPTYTMHTCQSVNNCIMPVHEHCLEKYHKHSQKCLYCQFTYNQDYREKDYIMMNVKELKENLKYKYLINSYFYNSHDLRILVKANNATQITVVSYCKDGLYTCFNSNVDQINATDFRITLMNFHDKCRTQYVFINNRVHATNINKTVGDEILETTEHNAHILDNCTFQYKW